MSPNWSAMVPCSILAGTVLLVMLLDTLLTNIKRVFPLVTCLGGLGALIAAVADYKTRSYAFDGFLAHDGATCGFTVVIGLALALVSLIAEVELDAHEVTHRGEFYGLLSSAALGMAIMVASTNLITTFLGLELFSLALYLLCVFFPRENLCQEAGLKYFILSSLASAVMLYGMALVYGACGSTTYADVVSLHPQGTASFLNFIGLTLILCGLAFKLSAVPFHMWTPDVYQGAPTSVAAFMSVATKAAALGALWRFTPAMTAPLGGMTVDLANLESPPGEAALFPFVEGIRLLMLFSMLSVLLGNFLALPQKNLKRLLAYSSIAQAGYLLIGILGAGPRSATAILFYLIVYCFMNVGAFAVVMFLESGLRRPATLDDLNGLGRNEPGLTAVLTLCLLSLAGLPPAGGLLAKIFLLGSGFGAALPAVAVAIVGSVLGAYYYLNPVTRMYMRQGDDPRLPTPPWTLILALVLVVMGLLASGVFPQPVLDWAEHVGQAAFDHIR